MTPPTAIRRPLEPIDFIVSICVFNTLIFNLHVLKYTFYKTSLPFYDRMLFTVSVGVMITAIQVLVVLPVYVLNLSRPILFIYLYISAVTAYFLTRYGFVYDSTVIESVFSTNFNEFRQYWNFSLIIFLSSSFLLLFFIQSKIHIKKETFFIRSKSAAKLFSASLVCLFSFVFIQYKEVSSFLRNHRELRQMVVPLSPIYESAKFISSKSARKTKEFNPIGQDAVKISQRKQIFVFILGETARSDHFGVNQYFANRTTPLLEKRNIVSYKNVDSCGTSTAVSLPCMFSNMGRSQFNEEVATSTGNLLDVAKYANYQTLWIDNNTGCKGVCNRAENISLVEFKTSDLCPDGICYDEILVKALKKNTNFKKDQFFVLHMLGSHGPSYHLRYPKNFAIFQPTCQTSDLASCSQQEIVNTYDNTILYADHVIDQVIEHLQKISAETGVRTTALYASDHGESLGENGIYLHSLPYIMAPQEQKSAAIIYWDSDNLNKKLKLETDRISHDYIFSSVLNILNIQTRLYNDKLDFFKLKDKTQNSVR